MGNLAFQFNHQISHAKSRGFLLCSPTPLCFACSMSHSLFLASAKFPAAKFTTAQLTGGDCFTRRRRAGGGGGSSQICGGKFCCRKFGGSPWLLCIKFRRHSQKVGGV